MDVKSEIKSIIAKKASTLKDVCADLSEIKGENISPNNITNKLRRKTIKFEEVQDILNILGYRIEFIEKEINKKQ